MSLGIWEIVLLIVLVLLLFGAGKLPGVMQDVAKGVKAFKSGLADDSASPASKAKSKKK